MPAEVIADCLNCSLRFGSKIEAAFLATGPGAKAEELRAGIGPDYGSIWNADIVDMLIQRIGNDVSGRSRVPGIFGERIKIKPADTTLFAFRSPTCW